MDRASNLKAFILGSTGATGRELVNELVKSSNWSEVTVVVRRKLEEWDKFNDQEKSKLKVILKDNLDSLEDPSQWNLTGYNSVFSCLGARVNVGKEQFTKVDYTYPLYGGKLAAHFKVPHYSLVSTGAANPNSWYLYLKVKGQTEEALKAMKLPQLSIFQPGVLTNRRNDERFVEKCLGWMPFVPKSDARDVAKALRIEAELQAQAPYENTAVTWSHHDIVNIIKTGAYPEQKKK